MVINKKTANSDVCFLILARPADVLCAVSREVIGNRDGIAMYCTSVYDAIAALHTAASDEKPVILITRPAMLAGAPLAMTLRQYPALRLIGWLGPDERPLDVTDPAMMTVGTRDQLARAISAICTTLAAVQPSPPVYQVQPKPDAKIKPENYRLSHEEINALLGTG